MIIGVLGPEDSMEQARVAAQHYDIEQIIPIYYEHHQDIVPQVEKVAHKIDGLLCTGILPYQIIQANWQSYVPIRYVKHDSTTLHRALFHASYHHQLQMNRFSIDIFTPSEVMEIMNDLSLPFHEIYINESNDVQFHLDNYKQGNVDYCITALLSTYDQLRRENIPCFRVVPTSHSISRTFELLILEIEHARSDDAQISIGIIRIDQMDRLIDEWTVYDRQKLKLQLYEKVLDYGRQTYASVSYGGEHEYFIYGTKGEFLTDTSQEQRILLLRKIEKAFSISVSLGVGEGNTALEANNNARLALRAAQTHGGSTVAVRKINGHLMLRNSKEMNPFTARYDENKLVKVSEQIGLQVPYVDKIARINEHYRGKNISAYDFADAYDCSLRSARRILAMLTEKGYATLAKQDQVFEKGRKRRYYTLHIIEKL
ncbi:hypothetical protein ACE1TF_15105 [Geomicrobium sp. JSM 1781026]|uniref:hypothetical protein n=1 Tax=Geomicrobium sp. JSM 1781026 TaxID=3344580 RepID=UPI0035C05DA9